LLDHSTTLTPTSTSTARPEPRAKDDRTHTRNNVDEKNVYSRKSRGRRQAEGESSGRKLHLN
jgi:hypothetical protein